jgi:hypothetical protein
MRRRILKKRIFAAILTLPFLFASLIPLEAVPAGRKRLKIIDYRKHLNRRFKKVRRKSTQFIIIHTSEAGLNSTLRSLSRGKSMGRYRTVGGHSHYAIARDGKIYRILGHRYRADHAGLSMWNGIEDISSHSLGVELVGYHYGTITPQQYSSLSRLLESLQRTYRVKDKNVLTHSQVSYGRPNMWFKRKHRGRKRCALNFQREKAGLKDAWHYDPDVRTRRLARDYHIYAMFYKRAGRMTKERETIQLAKVEKKETPLTSPEQTAQDTTTTQENTSTQDTTITNPPQTSESGQAFPENEAGQSGGEPDKNGLTTETVPISNIISKQNTAWNIAGEDYNDSTTLYILPGNKQVRGDQLGRIIGWNRIPTGTQVMLNQPFDIEKKVGPVFLISKEYTAWSFAQADYSRKTTIYFLPNGRIRPGNRMSDWDSIPNGTRMIIGYSGPFSIRAVKGQTPWGIAGRAYNHPETVYLIPGQGLVTGDNITDFSDLPRHSKLFLKTSTK